MYLLDILNNMNDKKCMYDPSILLYWKIAFCRLLYAYHFSVRFPLSLDNIRMFKLMNLQNTLNDLTENACLKYVTVLKHWVASLWSWADFHIFLTLGVYISENIIFKITQIKEYKVTIINYL